MYTDFLFELGCEELPTYEIHKISQLLEKNIISLFQEIHIEYENYKLFYTSRRIALLIKNINVQNLQFLSYNIKHRQFSYSINRVSNSCQLYYKLENFCIEIFTKCKNITISNINKRDLYYKKNVYKLVLDIIIKSLSNLSLNPQMKWGNGNISFIRPVRWILILLGNVAIKSNILGVRSGNYSYGHKFYSIKKIKIYNPRDYEILLNKYYVVANINERKNIIHSQILNIEKKYNINVVIAKHLLQEIINTVEWPTAILSKFSDRFLSLPEEILISIIQNNQKCFPVRDCKNNLKSLFIIISNTYNKNTNIINIHNEKIMNIKLNDAMFFLNQDKNKKLINYFPELKKIIFQEQLGNFYNKVIRIFKIIKSELLVPLNLNKNDVIRTIKLSKCDLLTTIIHEFPKLQGIIGYHYALHDNEKQSLALAIKEQYLPRFAKDTLPTSNLGLALSLSDRIDTIVGMFLINKKPTSRTDPFQLRRHAIAINRILLNIPYPIFLSKLIEKSYLLYTVQFPNILPIKNIVHEVKTYILYRLKYYLMKKYENDIIIHSIMSNDNDCIYDINNRIHAWNRLIKNNNVAYTILTQNYKRIMFFIKRLNDININNIMYNKNINTSLLITKIELDIFYCINDIKYYYKIRDYDNFLIFILKILKLTEQFFNNILILDTIDKEIKFNRILLLIYIRELISKFFKF